jgi:hypothetical protein
MPHGPWCFMPRSCGGPPFAISPNTCFTRSITAQKRQKKPPRTHPAKFESSATPPTQPSTTPALSNTMTGHARYPLTGFGGKRIPGSYFFCNKHDIVWENMIFCYIGDMIVIRCYKYTACGSCYLSTHSFKVRWECLAKKPKAICFHCFKDKKKVFK